MKKRRIRPTFLLVPTLILCFAALFGFDARADEEDDLQRQIDTQRAGVTDLENLDRDRAAAAEIQRLRDWLAEAWDLRTKHEPEQAREVLDRCMSQAELIRQVIAAASLKADVASREQKLKQTRDEIQTKRKALEEAVVRKKMLEPAIGKSDAK